MRKEAKLGIIFSVALLTISSLFVAYPYFKTNASILSMQWEGDGKLLYEGGWPNSLLHDDDGSYYLGIYDSAARDTYVRKMDGDGDSMWADDVLISTSGVPAKLVSDGEHGVIAVYIDDTGNTAESYNVYVQKINSSGVIQWTSGGIKLSNTSGGQGFVDAIGDGSGGVIVTWRDARNAGTDIYAQRVNSSGVLQWGEASLAVGILSGAYKSAPYLVTDGAEGCIITWSQNEDGFRLLRAQKVSGSGVISWDSDGILVSSIVSYNAYPVSDEEGGALVVGSDGYQMFLQHLDSDGSLILGNDGKVLASSEEEVDYDIGRPTVGPSGGYNFMSDGHGDYLLAWSAYDLDGYLNLYAQKIDVSGNALWNSENVTISDAAQDQYSLVAVTDGNGGMISVWSDFKDDPEDSQGYLYAQHISDNGTVLWDEGGIQISENIISWATYLSVVEDNQSGAIITWRQLSEDYTLYSLYGKRLETLNQIKITSENLDVLDEDGNSIKENSSNGANSTSENIRIKDIETGAFISEVAVDLTADRDWSDVNGASDVSGGKVYVSNLEDAPGVVTSHTLYIPRANDDTEVVICPDATSLSAVSEDCTNSIVKDSEDTDTSIVTIDEQSYWKVVGLTGTGGLSILGVSDTDTATDEESEVADVNVDSEDSSPSESSTADTTENDTDTTSEDTQTPENEESATVEDTTSSDTNAVTQEEATQYTKFITYALIGGVLIIVVMYLIKKYRK